MRVFGKERAIQDKPWYTTGRLYQHHNIYSLPTKFSEGREQRTSDTNRLINHHYPIGQDIGVLMHIYTKCRQYLLDRRKLCERCHIFAKASSPLD